MRWRGVSHVELAVLNYKDSIAFNDALFGWLGYRSFSSLNMEYQSMYYMTRFAHPTATSAFSRPVLEAG